MVLFSDSWTIHFSILAISIFSLSYWFVKQKYTYWKRKGFKSYPSPNFLFGHFGPTFKQKESIGELTTRMYKSTSEPFLGIYGILSPILLVCDLQAVRNILMKDFQHFTDRTYNGFFKTTASFLLLLLKLICFCTSIRWSTLRWRFWSAFGAFV